MFFFFEISIPCWECVERRGKMVKQGGIWILQCVCGGRFGAFFDLKAGTWGCFF